MSLKEEHEVDPPWVQRFWDDLITLFSPRAIVLLALWVTLITIHSILHLSHDLIVFVWMTRIIIQLTLYAHVAHFAKGLLVEHCPLKLQPVANWVLFALILIVLLLIAKHTIISLYDVEEIPLNGMRESHESDCNLKS